MAGDTLWIRQAAAIPIRGGKICLVTSSGGKRWVVPKGIIDPGMTAAETALQESWEEAGLVGTLEPEPVGTYFYQKWEATCHVTVFRMHVTEAADDWPERTVRQRALLTVRQALAQIEDEGLREVIRKANEASPRK
jgi:8-oxo-dGTP pyrophosphatase MutT (NUDIX family)